MIEVNLISSYIVNSKNIYYSLLFIAPLFFLYELMCWMQYANKIILIRNSADIFIQNIINEFMNNITPAILLLIFSLFIIINRKKIVKFDFKLYVLFLMLVESFIWAIIFIMVVASFNLLLLSIIDDNILFEQYYLAVGAGLWEELLFRVILIMIFMYLANKVLKYNYLFSAFLSILVSSILFSLFHYLGPFGDEFFYSTFYLRTFAGFFLGTLYLLRGYGIVVYTHVLYDFFIISNTVITYKQ